ncbi:MAG: hypothetical protein HZA89_13660 [Verrucomicrobia bacterium]|nr:hypothetical protein [Verrucomicrobiota bacterium]
MKLKTIIVLSTALCVSAVGLSAQEAKQMEQLQQQLRQMQEQFEKQQELQRQQIEGLRKQIEALQKNQAAASSEQEKVRQMMERPIAAAPPDTAAGLGKKPWRPTDPLRVFGGQQSYMNISFDGLFAMGGSTARDIEGGTQLGGHDPTQRGFTLQNLELTFDGAVDPYFRGQANVVLQIDSAGETIIEAEEAYLETLSLPGRLQLKAGQYFTEFGRHNPTHPHTWGFVDTPLVNGRFLGGDGLRNLGARASWLLPTPFYSELFFSVQNGHGETAHSFRNGHEGGPFLGRLHTVNRVTSPGDFIFTPRYAASFELTDAQTLLLGASAAFGKNGSGPDARTQLYGVDAFWKWKPANHSGGFPFVSWQTEAMLRKYSAGAFNWDLNADGILDPGEQDGDGDGVADILPRELLTDYGFYSQLSYGFRPGWVAGLRGDYVTRSRQAVYEALYGDDADRLARWRVSPNLTWYPSEFSKIRLQYNYDRRDRVGTDHSLWLQFEFLLGAHAAHKF